MNYTKITDVMIDMQLKTPLEIIVKNIKADAIDECISKINELVVYYAGDKEGNAITPKVVIKEDAIKVLEQLKEQRDGK